MSVAMLRALFVLALAPATVALAPAAVPEPSSVGYRYDQVERFAEQQTLALPSPAAFAPAFAAALARREMFERRDRRVPAGRLRDEYDEAGAGRPSTWHVRADGTTRVDYGFLGRRVILIFDPHRHELIWADPQKRTYRLYDTGPSDAFFTSRKPRETAPPAARATPVPVTVEPPVRTALDGRAVAVYRAALTTKSFEARRADYVSALPRPPIVPFIGFYQVMNAVGLALGPAYREPPDGLVLFRAVAFAQTGGFSLYTCQRGNVTALGAQDASLFGAPAGYRRDGDVAPSPKFDFARDTDDFIAFHACDDAVARTDDW
jgi:hypothetical protein